MDRVGLTVHPRRVLDGALATIERWAAGAGAALVQVDAPGAERAVAPRGEAADCDLVVALGGDGTTLAALHAAAPAGRPVLGVACGSLGALTAVTADALEEALDRVAAGDWEPRRLPAVAMERAGGPRLAAVNDVVLVRAAAGQVLVELRLDGELVIRLAGDGIVAATPLGSTAYTLAVGGPMLAPEMQAVALTPLAAHGGVCPPLVAPASSRVEVVLDGGNGGARLEVDGQVRDTLAPRETAAFAVSLVPGFATLVSLGEHEPLLAGLRRRRILLDSPRVLARADRDAAPAPAT